MRRRKRKRRTVTVSVATMSEGTSEPVIPAEGLQNAAGPSHLPAQGQQQQAAEPAAEQGIALPANTAMAPNIPPPSPMSFTGEWSINWEVFRAEFEDYSLVTGLSVRPKNVQAAMLRTVMGSECRHIYRYNLNLTAVQQNDPVAILNGLEEYFKPAKNTIYERYVFGRCKQEDGESIDSFITRLREKAGTCEYGQLKDEMIRDKIVLGISDEGTRRRLLREKTLTLVSAIETCRAAEQTDRRMKMIVSTDATSHADAVHAVAKQRFRPNKSKPSNSPPSVTDAEMCRYCGYTHRKGRQHCAAFGKACKLCGTQNHFAKMCMKSKRNDKKLHCVEELSDSDSNNDVDIYMHESIGAVQAKGKKWFVTLQINQKSQQCQLDSGATCDVMSYTDKMKLAPNTALKPSKTRLKLYSGDMLTSMGIFETESVIKGQTHPVTFEVVKTTQKPLLSGTTCERLGLIKFMSPAEVHAVEHTYPSVFTKEQLTKQYGDVFNSPVEAVPGVVRFELDPTVDPVQCAPRNVPIAMKADVKALLDQYQADGHIADVSEPTDWISNMVIVKKPGKLRICLDPKFLNKALKRSHYIMPTLEDVLYKLPKARLFSLVDAKHAFLQCKLDDESSLMTTFWTPWGRKRWLKLPFGVSVAPEIYQRKQHELLAGLKGVEPIADDILVVGCGDSDEEAERDHDANLRAVMERCREVKLRLSLTKLQFKLKEVRFHGHILSASGLKPDPEKVKAIVDMPNPEDAKGVQRLIGFANYLAKFMPHLSAVCEPLRRLLDKDTPWHWLPKHDAAVSELKSLASSMPVLRYYDVTRPVTVQSDSSQSGLGCCLMQEGQPIAFASRALTPTERNYAQIEKECLSIVFACQRFHHYLYGRDLVTVETDHKPLISIFSKPLLSAPKRLQSMLLTLQYYNLRIVYKPGVEMFISDTLSRATTKCSGLGTTYTRQDICSLQQEQDDAQHINQAEYLNVSDQRLEQIRRHTDRDKCLQSLKSTVLAGWPETKESTPHYIREYWTYRDEISVQNGILFRGQKVIIPKSMRPEMLTRIHSCHIGGNACYRQAKETLYWPNMQAEIKDKVSGCLICSEYTHNQQKESMLSHELPTRPWQIVSMDLFAHREKDYLLIVDHYSDFWEIELLPDLSADTVIKRCKAQFARHGQPDKVITDNGPQFSSQFKRFALEWEFDHVTSSPRHPKANGKAESAVKIAKNLLRRAARDGADPWKAILHWRNTPTENMDSSPAQRLMSRRLKTSIPVTNKLLEPSVPGGVTEKLRRRRQIAKHFYDRTAKDLPELEIGESIRMKPLPSDASGRWRRGTCLQQVAPRSYLVDVEGTLYRRNRVDLRVAEPTPSSAAMDIQGPAHTSAPEVQLSGPASGPQIPPTVSSPTTPDPVASPPGQQPLPHVGTYTRAGRLSKPPQRLNL